MQVTGDFSQLSVNDIVSLIASSLSGDNGKIQESTKLLKTYTKHKSSIRTLTYILVNSQDMSHRQMTTVLLKRNIIPLYNALQQNEKIQFRGLLLGQYVRESHLLIQRGIATLIGMLLSVVEIKNWVQLQQLLDQAISSAPQSAATFVLLNNLLSHFTPPKSLFNYLFNALRLEKLADQAMKCIIAVTQTQDVDGSFANELIRVWGECNWSQQLSIQALQVLNVMAQRKIKLNDQITIWLCDRIVGNRKLAHKMRIAGIDYLFSLADFSSKALGNKPQVLKKVVETICLTCSQPYSHRDDDMETGQFVQEVALWLIETLAISIKSKKIYPVLFEAAVALIGCEDDSNKMNTGFLILGAMCEGCTQKIKRNLANPIMNVLIPKGLASKAAEARGAAINALCYFSQFLSPDILQYHALIIPSMVNCISDQSGKVVSKALIAIDVFFDSMEPEEIVPYLPTVVPILIGVAASTQASVLMRTSAVCALGSGATAAGKLFQPYLSAVIQVCNALLSLGSSPQINSLRAQNLTLLGKLSNIFCNPQYNNSNNFYRVFIMPAMQLVYKLLISQRDPQMRQATFCFFYMIANAIGTQFEPVFDNIIHHVLKACQIPQNKQGISLDSDSQEEDSTMPIKSAEYDERVAAIHALGELGQSCPGKFAPYFQQAYKILDNHYQFFYDNVRIEVCYCYTNLTLGYVKLHNNGVLPTFEKGLPCVKRLTPAIEQHFRTELIPRLIFIMTEDQVHKTRGAAIQTLDELIKKIGPVLIDRSIEPIKDVICKLLEAGIEEEDSEDEQEPEEQDETEIHTFQNLCYLIPTLAQTLEFAFEPSLAQIHPYLMRFLEVRENVNDNIYMTGCLSQCFKHVPGYVVGHHQQLFMAITGLHVLWNPQVNRNVAYCLAEMFEKSANVMGQYIPQGLLLLKQIYEHTSSDQACKDNAVAAICRIIYTLDPPMPHAVFVNNLIPMLPFKGDQQQQTSAWKAIMYLVKTKPQVIQPHVSTILQLLEHDLANLKKYYIQPAFASELTAFREAIRGH